MAGFGSNGLGDVHRRMDHGNVLARNTLVHGGAKQVQQQDRRLEGDWHETTTASLRAAD